MLALRTLRLTEQEAEALAYRLRVVEELLPHMQRAYHGGED